jgi:hypothetical protein
MRCEGAGDGHSPSTYQRRGDSDRGGRGVMGGGGEVEGRWRGGGGGSEARPDEEPHPLRSRARGRATS